MSSTHTPKVPAFVHRGPEESICMECFATVRPQPGQKLDQAELWHGHECICVPVNERETTHGDFAHREILPGVIQVKCLRCLAGVGTAATLAAISALERAHKCKA